jgi:hypothetical protein
MLTTYEALLQTGLKHFFLFRALIKDAAKKMGHGCMEPITSMFGVR